MTLTEVLKIAEDYAPLSLSEAFKQKGAHDNSGVIVKCHDSVSKILFCLDLSEDAISKAIKIGADTIITHHPAIYYPISSLEVDGSNANILLAVKNNINIISMHLNLDIASEGVDYQLATALGAKSQKIIQFITDDYGYGRECAIEPISFEDFILRAVKNLKAKNYSVFAKTKKQVKKFASFCGAGSSEALTYTGNADTIITSDMPHHVIKKLIDDGKRVVLFTHYATEFYGFNKFANYFSKFIEVSVFDEAIYY